MKKISLFYRRGNILQVELVPPHYKMWEYEKILQHKEIKNLFGKKIVGKKNKQILEINGHKNDSLSRLTFYHYYNYNNHKIATWQKLLETEQKSLRKNSKYVTHGIHLYKGKFYPQLVKSLLNISHVKENSIFLDPYCGSGTSMLEGYLNGMKSFGCDLNPLAVLISKTKLNILQVSPDELVKTIKKITDLKYLSKETHGIEYFPSDCRDEILRWFPLTVIKKIAYLKESIDQIDNPEMRNFFLVILSGIIRRVSQQDQSDLRIRYRKDFLKNAPVFRLFKSSLKQNEKKILYFHKIKSFSNVKFQNSEIWLGDNTKLDCFNKELQKNVDVIITSPPYATALPYIDTDRLSLLSVLDFSSKKRRKTEFVLTGSREIEPDAKGMIENDIKNRNFKQIKSQIATNLIKKLYKTNLNSNAGFRKKNMPSLLYRYFQNISLTLGNIDKLIKKNGSVFFVVGDNFTVVQDKKIIIPSTSILHQIASSFGWNMIENIPISVTTENLHHIGKAIKRNSILHYKK